LSSSGGQAVNFWASYYERRVPERAREAPFTSQDIDFCGDQRAVRMCAERLGGKPRVATFDDATPNSGTVVFVDAAGVTRTLDIVSDAAEVHATALDVEILDDAGAATGARFELRDDNSIVAGVRARHGEKDDRARRPTAAFAKA
jgi:hypothetical protein